MAALKYSRQRESIKEFLRSRTDHPTADTVYENLRQIYPNISLGTVYRNLSLLSDIGELGKLTSFGRVVCFVGCVVLFFFFKGRSEARTAMMDAAHRSLISSVRCATG